MILRMAVRTGPLAGGGTLKRSRVLDMRLVVTGSTHSTWYELRSSAVMIPPVQSYSQQHFLLHLSFVSYLRDKVLRDSPVVEHVVPRVLLVGQDLEGVGQGEVGVEVALLPEVSGLWVGEDLHQPGVSEVRTQLGQILRQGPGDWDPVRAHVNGGLEDPLPGYIPVSKPPSCCPVAGNLSRHGNGQGSLPWPRLTSDNKFQELLTFLGRVPFP